MRKVVELVRPQSAGTWLVYVMAAVVAVLFLAFILIGETSLQRLGKYGTEATVDIAQVIERDASGTPTKIVVDRSWDGVAHELTDLEGSLVGDKQVRVQSYPGDQTMMSVTAYADSSVWRQTASLALGPLAAALLIVVALNWRRTFARKTENYWARVDS